MINKKTALLLLFLTLLFSLVTFAVSAESSIAISYRWDDVAISNLEVKLYRVSDVSEEFEFTLTEKFSKSDLNLNGIQTNGEWDVICSTLESFIVSSKTLPDAVSSTDESGIVRFESLETGMYLAVAEEGIQNSYRFRFDSALLPLPSISQGGERIYDLMINAKPELSPPSDPEEKIEFKLLKLWKGDEGENRPKSVEVEIFRGGEFYESVTLSEENNWSYSWIYENTGENWTVAEKNVPEGYRVSVEERDFSFILTNTHTSDTPRDYPKTGDSSNLLFYVFFMAVSGVVLIVLGIIGKRRDNE